MEKLKLDLSKIHSESLWVEGALRSASSSLDLGWTIWKHLWQLLLRTAKLHMQPHGWVGIWWHRGWSRLLIDQISAGRPCEYPKDKNGHALPWMTKIASRSKELKKRKKVKRCKKVDVNSTKKDVRCEKRCLQNKNENSGSWTLRGNSSAVLPRWWPRDARPFCGETWCKPLGFPSLFWLTWPGLFDFLGQFIRKFVDLCLGHGSSLDYMASCLVSDICK